MTGFQSLLESLEFGTSPILLDSFPVNALDLVLDYFSSKSTSKLENIEKGEKILIEKLSKDLNIAEDKGLQLLRSYLAKIIMSHATPPDLATLDLSEYYRQEKIALIKIIANLITIQQDSEHAHHELASELLQNIINDNWIARIIQQLEKVSVEAQIALVDLLFVVFYGSIPCSHETLTKLLQALVSLMQTSESDQLVWNCLLVTLEIFNMESLLGDDWNDGIYTRSISSLDTLFKSTSTPCTETLAFAWNLVVYRLSEMTKSNPSSPACNSIPTILDSRGLPTPEAMFDLSPTNIVTYLQHGLKTSTPGQKSVIKGLLSLLTTDFSPHNLPCLDDWIQIFCLVLQDNPVLASLFWQNDFPDENKRGLLDAASVRFPANPIFLRLLLPLSQGDAVNATLRYLRAINTFCHVVPPNTLTNDTVVMSSHQGTTEWLTKKDIALIPRVSRFKAIIPSGTVGITVATEPKTVVQWRCKLSSAMFLSMVESYLLSPSSIADWDMSGTPKVDIVAQVLKLFSELLKAEGGLSFFEPYAPIDVIHLLFEAMERASTSSPPALHIVGAGIECLTQLVALTPDVWTVMRASPLFARDDGGLNDFYLSRIIRSGERTIGKYQCTLAYLEFLRVMILDALQGDSTPKADLLRPNLAFVVNELFPSYSNWRFVNISDRFALGQAQFEIFNLILSDATLVSDPDQGFLLGTVLDPFFNGVGHSGRLVVLEKGQEVIEGLFSTGRVSEAMALEKLSASTFEFLVRLLTWRQKLYPNKITAVEKGLLERHKDVVCAIAGFVEYGYNLQLPLLAIQCLTLLVISSDIMDPRPSLVGALGSNVERLASQLMEYLEGEYDEELKTCIWRFVSQCVHSQPAFATLVLTGKFPLQKKGNKPTTDSVLNILVKLVEDPKEEKAVLAAALGLLEVLWEAPHEHRPLLEFVTQGSFWMNLANILLEEPIPLKPKGQEVWLDLQGRVQMEAGGLVQKVAERDDVYGSILSIFSHELLYNQLVGQTISQDKLLTGPTSTQHTVERDLSGQFKDAIMLLKKHLWTEDWINHHLKTPINHLEAQEMLIWHAKEDRPIPVDLSRYIVFQWFTSTINSINKYGDAHYYNVDLLARKLRRVGELLPTEGDLKLIQMAARVNHALSINYSQASLLFKWRGFLDMGIMCLGPKFLSSNLDDFVLKDGPRVLNSLVQRIFRVPMSVRANAPQRDRIDYQEQVASALLVLTKCWTSSAMELVNDKTPSQRLNISEAIDEVRKDLLMSLVEAPALDDITSAIRQSTTTARLLLWTVVLRILRCYQRDAIRADEDSIVVEPCSILIKSVLSHLVFALNHTKDELSQQILISLISELLSPAHGVHPSQWMRLADDVNVFELLCKSFATGVGDEFQLRPTLSSDAGTALLALSLIPQAAEKSASMDVLSTFSNNSATPEFAGVELTSYVERGAHHVRNPLHETWCLMLAVVSSLLASNLHGSPSFRSYALGFAVVHMDRLLAVLDKILLGELHLADLEEAANVTNFLYQIFAHILMRPDGDASQQKLKHAVLSRFVPSSAIIFKRWTHYCTHPREMSLAMIPMTQAEKKMTQKVGDLTVFEAKMEWRMLTMIRNLFASLRVITLADNIMTRPCIEWTSHSLHFVQNSTVTSLTTLFDVCLVLAQKFQKLSENKQSGKDQELTDFLETDEGTTLETAVLVLVTQSALLIHQANQDNGMNVMQRRNLAIELDTNLRLIKDSVNQVKISNLKGNVSDFLDLLDQFCAALIPWNN